MIKLAKSLLKSQLDDEPADLPSPSVLKAKPKPKGAAKAASKSKPKLKKLSQVADKVGISTEPCLITELHLNMGRYDPDRPYTRLHASDVTKDAPEFCPRERALLIKTKAEPNNKYISTETRTYFDVGEAYHDLIRNVWGAKVSFGDWLCLRCDKVHHATYKPTECGYCGGKRFEYAEQRVLHGDTLISCGIDWQFKKPIMSLAVPVEIKSMNADDFKKLEAPLAEHAIRTKLYLSAIANASKPQAVSHLDSSMAYILYVTKGAPTDGQYLSSGGFMEQRTPFKMFTVKRDDESIEGYLDKGRQYKEFTEHGIIPSRICSNPLTKRAKECSMCKECFKNA